MSGTGAGVLHGFRVREAWQGLRCACPLEFTRIGAESRQIAAGEVARTRPFIAGRPKAG